MMRTRHLLIPLVVSIVILLALSTVPSHASPTTAYNLKTLTLNPSLLIPGSPTSSHYNYGMKLEVWSGTEGFTAHVDVPPGSYIKSIQLLAEDNELGADICLILNLEKPAQFIATQMGEVCTSGDSGEQIVNTWSINPQYVSEHYIPYVWLNLPAGNLTFYGVKIMYLPPS
jgi:hypothetical protein